MILINSIDTASFTLNGTRYVKNFVCLPAGQTHIQVVGAYDTKLQILPNTHYNQISVDGNTYGSQALLINALANVIFSKSSSSATINQNNVGVFNTTLQYSFTSPSNTILVSEIVNKINLTYAYAVSEVMTPYFFQFVRPAVQEGSDTPIQKKYIYLFTGGKGSYGLGNTPVASTQFKLIVESVLNPDDIVDDDSAIINYLGEIPDGDYISVANESNWDFFNTDYTYYFSYTTDSVLYYVVFVGEPGLYGVDNVLFTEDDFVDSTNSDALPYIPTLQEIINQGSTATTSNNISISTTGTGKLLYNGSEVLNTAKIGVANGVVPTDGANKIPVVYLPNAVMIYKGVWNLATNTPALSNGTGTAGWVYKVTGAPTPTNFNFGAGNIQLTNGDFVIYSDSGTWEKSDGSDAVTSVNGYQGVVDLTYTDVDAAPTVHTHSISDVTGLSTALDGKANTNGSNASGTWSIDTTGTAFRANRVATTAGDALFHWENGESAGVPPTWLWGGTNPTDAYVYNPTAFPVSTATQAALDNKFDKQVIISDFNTPFGFKILEGDVNAANRPTLGNAWAQGIQFSTNHNDAYANQLVFDITGNLYTRTKYDTVWGNWSTIPFDENVLHKTGDETKTGNLALDNPNGNLYYTLRRGSDTVANLASGSGGAGLNGILQLYHTAGVENARIYASGDSWLNGGNLGIGTSTPTTKLDVWDNSSNDLIAGRVGSIGVQAFTLGGHNSDANNAGLYIKTLKAGVMTEAMRVGSDGNVGIGTASPTYKLEVTGDARISTNFDVNGTLTVNGSSYSLQRFQSSGTDRGYIGQGDYAIPSASPTGLGLGAINDLQLGAGNTVRMTIKSDGNVGIGTALASISAKLDVNGDIYVRGKIRTDDGTNSYHAATVGQLNTAISTIDTNTLHTTGNEVKITGTTAFIDKVAIGTSSISAPSAKFTVSGSTDLFGVLNVSSSASFGGEVLVATADGSSPYAAVNINYLDQKLNGLPQIINNTTVSALSNTTLNTTYPAVAIGTQIVCGAVGTGVIYVKINSTGGGTWRQMYLNTL